MKTIHVDFSFTVEDDVDADSVANWVFDLLCDQPDAPYESADGYDVMRRR